MTYLAVRNGTYYFRSRIPNDLVAILGRSTVYRSLNTASVRLALNRCGLIAAALSEIFGEAREGNLRRDEIKQRLESVFHEILERQCKYIDRYGTKSRDRTDFLKSVSLDLRSASEFERQGQIPEAYRALKETDAKFTLERVRRAMRRLDHKPQSQREASLMKVEVFQMLADYYEEAAYLHERSKQYVYEPAKVPANPAKRSQLSVSAALTKFAEEKARAGKWTEKTAGEMTAPVNMLIEACGDIPVKTLSKDDAVRFKEVLAALPPNLTKIRDSRFPDLTIEDIAELDHDKNRSPHSINKTLSRVGTLFDWCKRNNYCAENPFTQVRVEVSKRKASDERDAFEPEEVGQIIDLAKAETVIWKQWVPLIGAYSGMRLNEICQLYKDDIVKEDGIWCFRITDAREDQKVKTDGSKRFVPIHSKLIEWGVLELAKGEGNERVFPDLKLTKNGYGDAVSKWFGRTFKDRLTLKPGNKSFHSLRHSFVTALKRANVPEPAVKAIVGHVESSITFGRYGGALEIAALHTFLETIEHDVR